MSAADSAFAQIARDLVEHFDNRLAVMDGKAMVVCMSRRICVQRHDAITALRPAWHADTDDKGAIKVVMTGSAADGPAWQGHRARQRDDRLDRPGERPCPAAGAGEAHPLEQAEALSEQWAAA